MSAPESAISDHISIPMENPENKNIIAIGDVHHHWVTAEAIAEKYEKTHTIVFVGDYFDDWHDTSINAHQTAIWLKESLAKPNRIHLLGNHDINYASFNVRKTKVGIEQIYCCSGYTLEKDKAIGMVLDDADWKKLKVAHFGNGFWFSHGGFHPFWFANPLTGMSHESIRGKLEKIESDLAAHRFSNELSAPGKCRGGAHRVGGLLWRDQVQEDYLAEYWNDSSGIRQISGHTPLRRGIDVVEHRAGGVCIDIDCGLSEVIEVFPDGQYKIIDTGFHNFYLPRETRRIDDARENMLKRLPDFGAYDSVMNSLNKS